ncbi:uncharacterized protein [Drosophila tropicalis]|uniref:uncharacterized protein n=1 Tax=Drosophila tropicalis TaxID=46794 RepID=UPI0035ABD6F2
MIYLHQFLCCIDLQIGAIAVGIAHIVIDLIGAIFVAIFGESGAPDLCHKLFIVFMIIHIASAALLIYASMKLLPRYMLFYILCTMVQALTMIILIISDIILRIWYPVIIIYVLALIICLYFWLVSYSFYAALGGPIFI